MLWNLELKECDANAIAQKDKLFDIRCNNLGYQKGDRIKYTVIENESLLHPWEIEEHPLNDILFEITYVSNNYGLKDNYVVLGIREIGS